MRIDRSILIALRARNMTGKSMRRSHGLQLLIEGTRKASGTLILELPEERYQQLGTKTP